MKITLDRRKEFFKENTKEFWYDLSDSEYALFDVKKITQNEVDEIRNAAKKIYHIYAKTTELVRNLEEETLLELGYPKEFIPYIKVKNINPETIISRLDIVKDENGLYKHYEINADTPTFIKELFQINGVLTKHFDLKNPNEKEEEKLKKEIKNAIMDSYSLFNEKEYLPNVVFVSHKENEEDWYTTKYLSDICELPNELLDFSELIINNEGLYTKQGKKIDILYRQTYPVEYFLQDEDEGKNIGVMLLDLVKEGKLALINPLSAFIMQNKSMQALIWSLYEQDSSFFTKEEKEIIKNHFIPTYFDAEELEGKKFVKKPIYGREGDTIKVYDENNKMIHEDKQTSYKMYNSVYQEFVSLPKEKILIKGQLEERFLLTGTFLISGEPSSIGYRAGNQITGNESEFLSIGIEKENE